MTARPAAFEFYLVLSHIIAADGLVSALASNADEMLDVAGGTEAHAVILDCRPGNEMATICSQLRQDSRTSTPPWSL